MCSFYLLTSVASFNFQLFHVFTFFLYLIIFCNVIVSTLFSFSPSVTLVNNFVEDKQFSTLTPASKNMSSSGLHINQALSLF